MNLILLGACLLFVLCAPVRHVAKHHQSCEQITKGFDGNSDAWVSGFPVDQQHRALVCLDKLAKRQGQVK